MDKQAALGVNVCNSLKSVIKQALDLLVSTPEDAKEALDPLISTPEDAKQALDPLVSTPEDAKEEVKQALDPLVSTSEDAKEEVLTESLEDKAQPKEQRVGTEEEDKERLDRVNIAHTMLLASCKTLESLVASHRSHRWLLLEAGVGEDLIRALNCCTDQLEEKVCVSTESPKKVDYGLMNHICLAIGSLAKGSTFKNENQLLLGIPVLCRVLSIFSANPDLFMQTDKVFLSGDREEGKIELSEGEEGSVGSVSTIISESACRAIGYITSVQNNRNQSLKAKAEATRRLSKRLSMQGVFITYSLLDGFMCFT
jgi:hypothetical protein